MNRKLLAIIAATVVYAGVILSGVRSNILLTILSLPFILILPGYTLLQALFPDNKLELSERVALTLGLSLAISSLGGLILNWTIGQLATGSWVLLLGSIICVSSLVALFRQRYVKKEKADFTPVNLSLTFNQGLLFVLAGLGIAVTFVLAYTGEVMQNNSEFTQLWILHGEEINTVEVGISNHENDLATYRLSVDAEGELVEDILVIELQAEETRIIILNVPNYADTITARLYRWYESVEVCSSSDPPPICQRNNEIYREVKLWQ